MSVSELAAGSTEKFDEESLWQCVKKKKEKNRELQLSR